MLHGAAPDREPAGNFVANVAVSAPEACGHRMVVLDATTFSAQALLASLRRVRLRGFGGARPYAHARMELVQGLDPDLVSPAQNYVLRSGVDNAIELRRRLADWNIDPFALDGGAYVRTSAEPSRPRALLPPILEESPEADGRTVLLASDGLHRLFAARSLGLPISAVVIRGVSHPYYAFPLEGGWDGVAVLDELPDRYQKKAYRQPEDYKALFRDFNDVFPGVQEQRVRCAPSVVASGRLHAS
jgi:hypothetical protein